MFYRPFGLMPKQQPSPFRREIKQSHIKFNKPDHPMHRPHRIKYHHMTPRMNRFHAPDMTGFKYSKVAPKIKVLVRDTMRAGNGPAIVNAGTVTTPGMTRGSRRMNTHM